MKKSPAIARRYHSYPISIFLPGSHTGNSPQCSG